MRLLLAVGFAYAFATLVDQGGPASVRDAEAPTDAPFVVLTIAMVAVYAVLVGELAKIVAGEAVAKTARIIALGAAAAAAALVGELHAGAVWGSPFSDLVWTLDATMLLDTIAALLMAVVLGTRGCEIGVWAVIAARLRGGPASPPICIIGLDHLDEWEARRPHVISSRGRRCAVRTRAR